MNNGTFTRIRSTLKARTPPWLFLSFLSAVFFLVQHNFSNAQSYDVAPDDEIALVANGSAIHSVAQILLGVLSVLSIVRNRAVRRLNLGGPLGWAVLCFTVWALCSPIWAEDFSLTLRRTAAFGILCIAAVAVAHRYSLREIILWTFFTTLFFVLTGVLAEIGYGTFHPLESGYRFAGTLHPNGQGVQCGLLTLSALAAANSELRWRRLLMGSSILGFIFLILSGSRTSLIATLFATIVYVAAVWSRRTKLAVAFGLSVLLCICLSSIAANVISHPKNAITLGRVDDPSDDDSFNGRTTVWQDVGAYIRERPILGYGYGGFWTPKHIDELSDEGKWTVAASHSAYLDCLLSLGSVGFLTYALVLITGLSRAFRLYRLSHNPVFAFCGALVVFIMVDGVLDSIVLGTSLIIFIFMTALVRLAVLPSSDAVTLGQE
jgi:O-antigen ligase